MTTTTKTTPRIYVACLASYNSGKLHGEWIDIDDIEEGIPRVLESSPEPDAEDWAIHDYEGFFGIHIDENPDLAELVAMAALLEKHGEAYAAYTANVGGFADESEFEDSYRGEWESQQAYAEDYIDSVYDLDETIGSLASYFDYESFARDLFMGDCYSVDSENGSVFVFSN